MKKVKIIAALAIVMCALLAFCACGLNDEINVTVKISTDDYGILSEDTIGIPSKDATVLKAISEYCSQKNFSYTYNDESDSIKSIGDFKETEKNKFSYFWNFTVDGKEVSGRAAENPIADGATIVYNYTSIPIGDSVSVKFMAEGNEVVKETLVVIEEGDTVIDAAKDALAASGITYKISEDNADVSLVGEYQAKITPAYDETWDFTVNGKKANKAAGETPVSKDNKIVFTFNRTEKQVTEG